MNAAHLLGFTFCLLVIIAEDGDEEVSKIKDKVFQGILNLPDDEKRIVKATIDEIRKEMEKDNE